jgi:TatA/E family protein of Tat protein translocase
VGALELILIFALIVLIFGATRLPKLARSVGKAGLEDPPESRTTLGRGDAA